MIPSKVAALQWLRSARRSTLFTSFLESFRAFELLGANLDEIRRARDFASNRVERNSFFGKMLRHHNGFVRLRRFEAFRHRNSRETVPIGCDVKRGIS